MARSPSRRSTTRRGGGGPLWSLGLALLLGACASPGPVPQPGPAPGPIRGLPRFGIERPGRSLRYVEAIKQISLRAGHLGWGGLEVGMSFHQAELAASRRLPSLGSASRDMLCGYAELEAEALRQPLRLDFDTRGREEGRLKAIWLPLASPAGELSTLEIVRVLKARFPELQYVPSPHAPDLAESVNPRPLYQLGKSGMFFVDPRRGIYFGEICMD